MTISLKWYTDAALQTPVPGNLLNVLHSLATSEPSIHTVYLGSAESGRVFRSASDPGNEPITVLVEDATPGEFHVPDDVKLALSEEDLDTAVAGEPLVLGPELLSGAENAIEVWMAITRGDVNQVSTRQDLTVRTNEVQETEAA